MKIKTELKSVKYFLCDKQSQRQKARLTDRKEEQKRH